MEKHYQSCIQLNHLLAQTDQSEQRQSTENYIEIILNELSCLAEKILHLIEK